LPVPVRRRPGGPYVIETEKEENLDASGYVSSSSGGWWGLRKGLEARRVGEVRKGGEDGQDGQAHGGVTWSFPFEAEGVVRLGDTGNWQHMHGREPLQEDYRWSRGHWHEEKMVPTGSHDVQKALSSSCRVRNCSE
jgi:hypothetical protein